MQTTQRWSKSDLHDISKKESSRLKIQKLLFESAANDLASTTGRSLMKIVILSILITRNRVNAIVLIVSFISFIFFIIKVMVMEMMMITRVSSLPRCSSCRRETLSSSRPTALITPPFTSTSVSHCSTPHR